MGTEIISTNTEPMQYDFQSITYNADDNPTVLKAYRQYNRLLVSSITHNAGTCTVTTASNHLIILDWDATVAYSSGDVYVRRSGRIYKSLQASTNKDPLNESSYWSLLKEWDADQVQNVVSITSVTGITDVNNVWTVATTPSSNTFTFTYTATGSHDANTGVVQAGIFVYKWIYEYDTSGNLVGRTKKHIDD